MDGAIIISFGPFWDVMFRIMIVFGIFAGAAITFQYLELEVRSWFPKKGKEEKLSYEDYKRDPRDPENDEWIAYAEADFETTDGSKTMIVANDPTLKVETLDVVSTYPPAYIVQWGTTEDFDQFESTELRVAENPGQMALDLLKAYGDGHIRWRRTGDDDHTPEWKYQGFHRSDIVLPLSDKENADG